MGKRQKAMVMFKELQALDFIGQVFLEAFVTEGSAFATQLEDGKIRSCDYV